MTLGLSTVCSRSGKLMVLQFFMAGCYWVCKLFPYQFFVHVSIHVQLAFTHTHQNRKQCWIFSFLQLME